MVGENRTPSLGEAVTKFLASLPTGEREKSQPEVFKFARWYGWERPFSQLAPPHVSSYADQLSTSDTDYEKKFEILRTFFTYAKKAGWSQTNLSPHLKAKNRRSRPASPQTQQKPREPVLLSRQRYEELTAELERLKKRSQELVVEIQRAAADKDFRENAPLAAAREERGYVEGRIKELEEILKAATIIEGKKDPAQKTGIGDTVIIIDTATGEEFCYTVVDPREANPLRGKISFASPLGKALIGRCEGETVQITAPAGTMCYRIKQIQR
ncbi:MAG: transcription elongation factor GreA [Dehalococcoidales bacterium]|nr:transcription elongation factor GreA [Dehalococcoidales bacterium]